MNRDQRKRNSKFLSYVLRHHPEAVGLTLDDEGWVFVADLLAGCNAHDHPLTEEQLREVVETNDKKRFAFSSDGERIRASQGHSVNVELGYQPATPPDLLYHGTVGKALEEIGQEGLQKMNRHHVHLSANLDAAHQVGGRRGKPIVLTIQAGKMHEAGYAFFVSANGVWLADSVPPEFIDFPNR